MNRDNRQNPKFLLRAMGYTLALFFLITFSVWAFAKHTEYTAIRHKRQKQEAFDKEMAKREKMAEKEHAERIAELKKIQKAKIPYEIIEGEIDGKKFKAKIYRPYR